MPSDDDFNSPELPSARQQAAEWFIRLRDKPPSEEARSAFERWLAADPRNRKEYQAIQGVWQELDGLRETVSVGGMGRTAATRGVGEGNRGAAWSAVAVAAVLVLSVFTGLWVFLYDPGNYQTAKGEQRTLLLADQSVVHLNSDSALRVELTAGQRTLHLQRGEAYFEVAHDPARPFVVVAAGAAARAIGTRFDVYRQPSGVRVSVVEGRVEVAVGGAKELLNAGETVTYGNDASSLSPIGRNDGDLLDWLDGRIHFEATPLTKVVEQLNRYQETPLRIADPRLNDLRLSGTFRIANLQALPELLPRMLPVSLELTEDGVLLLRPN